MKNEVLYRLKIKRKQTIKSTYYVKKSKMTSFIMDFFNVPNDAYYLIWLAIKDFKCEDFNRFYSNYFETSILEINPKYL